MERRTIIGIDIGKTGAVAILRQEADATVSLFLFDIPIIHDDYDIAGLARILKEYPTASVVFENVHSMPKQGVASTFNFGRGKGIVEALSVSLCARIEKVSPSGWKKHYPSFAGMEKKAAKDEARRLCQTFYPSHVESFKLKKHHGRADAVLLARRQVDREKDNTQEICNGLHDKENH